MAHAAHVDDVDRCSFRIVARQEVVQVERKAIKPELSGASQEVVHLVRQFTSLSDPDKLVHRPRRDLRYRRSLYQADQILEPFSALQTDAGFAGVLNEFKDIRLCFLLFLTSSETEAFDEAGAQSIEHFHKPIAVFRH